MAIRHIKIPLLSAVLFLGFAAPASAWTTGPVTVTGTATIPTYSAAVAAFSNSSAGDLFCISGSATKIVKVKTFRISAIASAGIADDISIIKRSTADSGGTPTVVTKVPNDSANAPGTATVTAFGTAPTAGTTVGTVRAQTVAITTTTAPVAAIPTRFDFASYWDQPVVLHGTAESLCVNVPATAGGQWSVDTEWTEE